MNTIIKKKLLNSKWTVINPINKERHFLITKLNFDKNNKVTHCLIEAVISHQEKLINFAELKDNQHWLQGWK